jgi:ferritin heavy chain
MALSIIRQNYHAEAEALINKQINMELYASYVYLSMVIMMNYAKFMLS